MTTKQRCASGVVLLVVGVCTVLAGAQSPPRPRSFTTWSQYLGGADSAQYSALEQVNKSNVTKLQVVWTYPTDIGSYHFGPTVVGNMMYVLAKTNSIVALDAATGKELWARPNTGAVGDRGINYWEDSDRSDRRLVYVNGVFLTAIDARTGNTITTFGDNGRVDLRTGIQRDITGLRPLQTGNPGRIFQNLLIIGLPAAGTFYNSNPADIHAYDVRTGKLQWVFHTVPERGEVGADTWPDRALDTGGGVHNWSELTLDEQRGIVYVPLGTARFDFYGGNRHGDNLFANSLLALDARTGKRLWHFQTIHHDLWDYDLPAAPKLLTVRHDGKNVDVVAQPSKQGFLYVFDRVTGRPLWPIEERPVPQTDAPGERTSPTQPFPTAPPPFARQSFTEKDINPHIPVEDQAKLRERMRGFRNEGLFTPPSVRGTIEMPGHLGGANWGSSAVDPTKGTMYIVSKELPTLITLVPPVPGKVPARGAPPPDVGPDFVTFDSPYDFIFQSNGLAAIGPPWSRLTAYDLNKGTILWQVPHGEVSGLVAQGVKGTGSQAPRGGVVVTAGGLIFAATSSDRKLRAYDQDNGRILWEQEVPSAPEGIPAVYEINGRQYIAFCVAGGYGLQPPRVEPRPRPGPGQYMVFALPPR
jgi:quinoprotein glucose dehydrogenase